MNPTMQTTPETEALCKDIAKKSKGVCFIGISGGKDSLAALVYLHNFFHRIIPFHCASWPRMRYVKDYLDRLEYQLGGLHILRLIGEDFPMALDRMMYQPFTTCMEIEDNGYVTDDYSKLDILEYLRYKFNLPKAWCAFGISATDSIDRAIYVKKTGGVNSKNRTFYPCSVWKKDQIVECVKEAGLPLISSYRYVNRTMGNVPGIVTNEILKHHYPEDWERFLCLYPLAEAKTVREQILDREWAIRKREKIEANGGRATDGAIGADVGDGSETSEDNSFDGDWMEA